MPKVVAQTIVRLTMKTATAAKNGRQRAASHKSGGNNRATGTTVAKSSGGNEMTNPLIRASAATAAAPSVSSLREGGSRATEARPITSGATVMMPSASEPTQCCQMVPTGAVEP